MGSSYAPIQGQLSILLSFLGTFFLFGMTGLSFISYERKVTQYDEEGYFIPATISPGPSSSGHILYASGSSSSWSNVNVRPRRQINLPHRVAFRQGNLDLTQFADNLFRGLSAAHSFLPR
jgi:hypothetical protein